MLDSVNTICNMQRYKQCKPSCSPITLAQCDGKMSGRKVNGMPTSYTISDARQCVNENTCIHKYMNMYSTRQPNRRTVVNSIAPRSCVCNYIWTKPNIRFFQTLYAYALTANHRLIREYIFNFSRIRGEEDFGVSKTDLKRLLSHCCSWAEMLLDLVVLVGNSVVLVYKQ